MQDFTLFAGFAGDTDPGRFLSAGLYRSRGAGGAWQSIGEAIAPRPEVRAILTDPRAPGRVTVGTEDGLWRSDDAGATFRRLAAPRPGLAVWSLARDASNPDTIFAGYEPALVVRSRDDGATFEELPVDVAYPDVTAAMPKRILGIATDPANGDEIYAALEIGGMIRSLDGGRTWAGITEGTYINEDSVDFHAVATRPGRPGTVTGATRIGTFRSTDRGARWRDLAVPPLRPRGTYCRVLAHAPDDPDTLYVGGGNDFDGDLGGLFMTRDDGRSWTRFDLGRPLKTSIFGLALSPRLPGFVACTTKIGEVFVSADRGRSWQCNPLPAGLGHVFALAVA
ncbi:MAG TPA: hypothetical protein PKA74_08775 [Bauldia sp.]|nr:hypothetical protein [Bauldia sp.]